MKGVAYYSSVGGLFKSGPESLHKPSQKGKNREYVEITEAASYRHEEKSETSDYGTHLACNDSSQARKDVFDGEVGHEDPSDSVETKSETCEYL